MDLEQNVVDIKQDIGEIKGAVNTLIKVMPDKGEVKENTIRSKFNRKLLYLLITIVIGGGGITGVITSLAVDSPKEVKQ